MIATGPCWSLGNMALIRIQGNGERERKSADDSYIDISFYDVIVRVFIFLLYVCVFVRYRLFVVLLLCVYKLAYHSIRHFSIFLASKWCSPSLWTWFTYLRAWSKCFSRSSFNYSRACERKSTTSDRLATSTWSDISRWWREDSHTLWWWWNDSITGNYLSIEWKNPFHQIGFCSSLVYRCKMLEYTNV